MNTEKGCTKLGIDRYEKCGVVNARTSSSIFFPRELLPYLEPGTAIYVEDLEAWERKAGVKVSPGDAVLVRTGRWARREKLGPASVAQNAAGVHASVAPWFKARGVAFAGSDAALDVTPSLVEGNNLPVHTLFITAMGIHLLDSQDLRAAAARWPRGRTAGSSC